MDTKKIGSQTIADFLKELSSAEPTPGGGSSAALAAGMAASLIVMVANLTMGKKGYEGVSGEMKATKEEAEGYKNKLLNLADEDALAFEEVMRQYKAEVKNQSGLQSALKHATEVPLTSAKIAGRLVEMAKIVEEKGNKNAISDARSAGYLAAAARSSAMENVRINLESVTDEEWKKDILADCQASC